MKIKLLILALLSGWTALLAQRVVNVSHVAYTVSNLEQSIAFLETNVEASLIDKTVITTPEIAALFGVEENSLPLTITRMHIGNEEVRLLSFTGSGGRQIPHDSRSNDLWFQHIAIVVQDMEQAYDRVYQNGIEHVSTAPQTLPDYLPAAAGISAFYFRDGDDHNLELIHYPKGKGNPKWQVNNAKLFLGVDHTAIGISSTEKSLQFYRDALGLEIGGNSENFGIEQEHLNQVFGARLLITGLHADQGIGVEFLHYIAPPGGRFYPHDSTPLDLWHWHTAMEVDQMEEVLKKLENRTQIQISKDIVNVPELEYTKAVLVRDPDGHAVLLYEK